MTDVEVGIWNKIKKSLENGFIVTAGSKASFSHESHSYSILSASDSTGIKALKIRNPWGLMNIDELSKNSRMEKYFKINQ